MRHIIAAALAPVLAPLLAVAAPTVAAAQVSTPTPPPAAPIPATIEALTPEIEGYFADFMQRGHVPGLVWGVVKDGRLILVRGMGVQDTAGRAPVTADSRFRIASMSKAFTALAILQLAEEGKLSLDAAAETYVPEMKGWRYPTTDSPKITVRDLLHHVAGYVEDNPWGDRQQPLSEADFSKMLAGGVAFAQAPGIRMEYSNLGYATLGRIVTNIGGKRYQDWIGERIIAPLGMSSTGYDMLAGDQGRRALGYRWQETAGAGAWVREPDMADGAFGAMGGLQTTANDYWRWVSFLLSAWPARDGADRGPVKRGTVRRIVEGANFVATRDRPAVLGAPCRLAVAYAMGWNVVNDCDAGRIVTHTGGYPGYGSVVMLLPDAGVGVFAFSNRTYGAPSLPANQALLAIRKAGLAPDRALPVSRGLSDAYEAARLVWRTGDPARAPLAINVPLDRDLARRRAEIGVLQAKVGACAATQAIEPISAMEGTFRWPCAHGVVLGRVQRAPTPALSLQVVDFAEAPR